MSYLPLIDLKNGFWPVVHLLYGISEWNFTDMLNIKGYIFLVRTLTLTFPVHELSALDWSEKWFLTCSSFTIWSIWMKLHRYVDHQRLHIVTKDVISLSISVLLLFRHYISHKITFGAPSSGGVLRSACGAFIELLDDKQGTPISHKNVKWNYPGLALAIDPLPPGGISLTMISWYCILKATKWNMLALWERQR